jgi:hypothetical protein
MFDVIEHAIEMPFRAHHRPEVPQHLDFIELRETGFRDHLERLSRGIGEEVQMQNTHADLWKTMLKALAEGSGRFQEKLCSPFFEIVPQVNEE